MLAPENNYFLHQELSLFVYRPVKKLRSAPLTVINLFIKVASFYMTVALVDYILIIESDYLYSIYCTFSCFSSLDVQNNVLIFGFTTFQCATSFL